MSLSIETELSSVIAETETVSAEQITNPVIIFYLNPEARQTYITYRTSPNNVKRIPISETTNPQRFLRPLSQQISKSMSHIGFPQRCTPISLTVTPEINQLSLSLKFDLSDCVQNTLFSMGEQMLPPQIRPQVQSDTQLRNLSYDFSENTASSIQMDIYTTQSLTKHKMTKQKIIEITPLSNSKYTKVIYGLKQSHKNTINNSVKTYIYQNCLQELTINLPNYELVWQNLKVGQSHEGNGFYCKLQCSYE